MSSSARSWPTLEIFANSPALEPNVMAPNASLETTSPVSPKRVYCIFALGSFDRPRRFRDCFHDVAVTFRHLTAEVRPQAELGGPIDTARRGSRHDRLDADGPQCLGHFFHLAGAAFSVHGNSAGKVGGQFVPV